MTTSTNCFVMCWKVLSYGSKTFRRKYAIQSELLSWNVSTENFISISLINVVSAIVLWQPRNIRLLLTAAVSHSRRVGSEQPPVKRAARASQRWPGLSDRGEGKSASVRTWGSQQPRWPITVRDCVPLTNQSPENWPLSNSSLLPPPLAFPSVTFRTLEQHWVGVEAALEEFFGNIEKFPLNINISKKSEHNVSLFPLIKGQTNWSHHRLF